MHLLRDLRYDGPWLQLMPDSSEDCMVLERLAAAGVRMCGLERGEEAARLRGLGMDDFAMTGDEVLWAWPPGERKR